MQYGSHCSLVLEDLCFISKENFFRLNNHFFMEGVNVSTFSQLLTCIDREEKKASFSLFLSSAAKTSKVRQIEGLFVMIESKKFVLIAALPFFLSYGLF